MVFRRRRYTVSAFLVVALTTAIVSAQSSIPIGVPGSSAFTDLNRYAAVTLTGRSDSTDQLVQCILDRFGPVPIGSNRVIRDRIALAHTKFMAGKGEAISETRLVSVLNNLVRRAGAPAWAKTSAEQIHLFRTMLKPVIPSLIGAGVAAPTGPIRARWTLPSSMSPAEAVFVAWYLARGKAIDPDYQRTPEEWVNFIRRSKGNLQEGTPSSRGHLQVLMTHKDTNDFLRMLEANLKDDNGVLTRDALAILDQLGFPKRPTT